MILKLHPQLRARNRFALAADHFKERRFPNRRRSFGGPETAAPWKTQSQNPSSRNLPDFAKQM
jgi:hypothetical protein